MIELIKIKNYKSIRELILPMRRINILIGSNGAGKSNLISFFKMIQEIYNQRFGAFTMSQGIDNILYFGRNSSESCYGLIDFNNNNAFFFEIRPMQNRKGYIEYTGDYFNNKHEGNKDYSLWNRTLWDSNEEESMIIDNKTWRAGYLKNYLESFTTYHFHDTSANSPLRRECKIGDNTFLRQDGSNLAAYLYLLKEKYPHAFKLIECVIRSIAPYFQSFNLHPDRFDDTIIELEWKEKDSDMYLNGYNFSDGTIRFIALTTLLLQPDTPEVIIIDEPELGLHPAAIEKLASMIKRASLKSQIIISTQSSNLIDYFDAEDIVVVDRENKQSVFRRLDEQELTAWKDDYSLGQIWEKNIIGGQP